jgi:hypothetical protein
VFCRVVWMRSTKSYVSIRRVAGLQPSCPGCAELMNHPLRETRTAFFGGRGAKAQTCKGEAESRTGGGEGLPGCTREALRARKLGRGRVECLRASLTPLGILPANQPADGCLVLAVLPRSYPPALMPLRWRANLTVLASLLLGDGSALFR